MPKKFVSWAKYIQLLICLSLLFAININGQEKLSLFGKNLIINGGAEAGEAAWRGEGFESARYGSFGDEWDVGVAGAPNGGDSYFRLTVPNSKEVTFAKNIIDLSRAAEFIDKNPAEVVLSAYIGGSPSQEEKFAVTSLVVNFLDMDKKLLGLTSIEVKETELPKAEIGTASIVLRTKTEKLPKGTAMIEVVLKVKNACPTCMSIGYADNISLVLKPVK